MAAIFPRGLAHSGGELSGKSVNVLASVVARPWERSMSTFTHTRNTLVLPGITLISAGVLAAAVMMLHPEASGAGAEARLQSLVAISSLSMHVHLAMIVFTIAVWLSLAYAVRAWPASGWVWAASRLYSIAAVAMLGAALISGFVMGAYLSRALPAVPAIEYALPSALLAFSANQVLAGFSTVLMSLAILLWSAEVVRHRQLLARVCGIYGITAGTMCIVVYSGGMLSLNASGMTVVVFVHAIWYCLLGSWLVAWSAADGNNSAV